MKLAYVDGVRDFRYRMQSYSIEDNVLTIALIDIHYDLQVLLHYRVHEDENMIEKWREVKNGGAAPVKLERMYSGEFGIAGTGYKSINFNGHWGQEFQYCSEPVDCGKKVYESLCGITGHNVSPFFVIHKDANEDAGDVYYGVLQYSGNFKSVVEAVSAGYVNVLMGISDTDFEWKLHPGETFTTPSVFSGHAEGFTQMSNTLSSFARKHVMPKQLAGHALPVLYNSWYATFFDVRCDEQIKLAEQAASLGVELFVIDDGWFTGRVNDRAGLGDWVVDPEKFPDGLAPLIDRVHELGMKFGIWIEPEMVNAQSKLFQEHPDWIYSYHTRETHTGRNQYMLDLTNPAVIQYLIHCLDALLSNYQISFIKWDMNRYISEVASSVLSPDEYKLIWYKSTQGFYRIVQRIRELHPDVEMEACASGGGRVDYGSMAYFDEFWPSDNTDPLDRLFMQENYSLMYPIKYMRAWLTDDTRMNNRSIPLQFSMHAAMCGSLGIGTNLNDTSEDKLQQIRTYIDEYKKVRDIVQLGQLYRLKSFKQDPIHAVQYVLDDVSVLFVFLDHQRYGQEHYRIQLKGLDSSSIYRFEVNGKVGSKSGAFLTNMGLDVPLAGDYDSVLIRFEKVMI
jgi:alpha-galactosidase